ncbi:hypothetical protein PVAP13_2NG296900 [Panicum virgatum]|uniref:Uncharacterized protein n=1 Tax=Panicum virgatum TaxID=38727 RepID=A0A8T0VQ31_PANVG|nr:hypothetical protein PVAP13_2NG296900 [Panicum virgatum]
MRSHLPSTHPSCSLVLVPPERRRRRRRRRPKQRSGRQGRGVSSQRPRLRRVVGCPMAVAVVLCWRLHPAAAGKTRLQWEVRARVWVTYWPNKKRTPPLHTETRMLEVRELLQLTLA